MKILQLVTKRQYRGAEVFAANLSSELISLNHQILFVGLYKNDKDVLSVENAVNEDLSDSKTGSFSMVLIKKLVELIKTTQPDIIQCNGSDTLKYMAIASFFVPKVPVIYRNISMISEWIDSGFKRNLYKFLLKRINHVSSVGEEAVNDFISIFDYPRSKTSVIRRGIPIKHNVDPQAVEQLRKAIGLSGTDKMVIHIGNFSPEKNHQFLIEVFCSIKEKHPEVKLVCVGKGDLFEATKQEVKKRDLEETVFLIGFRKEVPELLAASECLLLSSRVEGVPGVILEAASQKVPAVATDVGGVSEVLVNNETGFIIPNFDKDLFEQKVLQIVLDEGLRKEMGRKAFELVSREYSPVKNAKRFEKLYHHLIQSKI